MAKSKKKSAVSVDAIRHKDKRANIPTEELRDFVAEDEAKPKTVLYPRDSSLDPQLVWKGKDEQDAKPLEVPVVPIYIQEKMHPQALIEDVRHAAEAAKQARIKAEGGLGPQMDLFADFNGLPEAFDQRVEFYHHEGNWSNRMILGDSLLVMTSLAEKEGLKGKVQTIYIDPPYGIGFRSNWQVSTRKLDVKDRPEHVTRQPEQIRAFRDTWKLGIHSYLAYLRDRLAVARDLLTETGSILVQIGDDNVHLIRTLLDETFGADNFISQISFRTKIPLNPIYLANIADSLVWYAKDREHMKFRRLFASRSVGTDTQFVHVQLPNGDCRRWSDEELVNPLLLPADSRPYRLTDLLASGYTESCHFEFAFKGKKHYPPSTTSWKTSPEGIQKLIAANRIKVQGRLPSYLFYADDYPVMELTNQWGDTQGATGKSYVVQTANKVIERCLLMTTDPGDLVLDPTCGSGTTAYVAEQWGRRWITIDTSRVALALARTRLMAAKYPYYYLADNYPQIAQMNTDEEIKTYLRQSAKSAADSSADIRKGFVYKRVPHVTLGSIANNPDIHEGMSQAEIDAAIARHADHETLYDQPYEDAKRVRVSGPFTVESLSPHRVLAADENLDGTVSETEASKYQDFATMILDNLRKAGVQNTKKTERLKFDRLDPFAGKWIHAVGEFTESDPQIDADKKDHANDKSNLRKSAKSADESSLQSVVRRVAVSIGPEHGTVGPQQVKEAAKEAVQGVGFDVLIVCGFAFDPHVSEEAKRYGKLTVLPCRMNPDLAMGDELLKKTGVGNLFMVFGEPDVDIQRSKDGRLLVTINGVDVYDPTTGQIRSSSTDDIACWFIDTNYNGESFFVRHAYFTGADEPYQKLKRALRAEVDEAAWSSLYSTTSRPFDRPETGKIAVKVINHYGDEVLKVLTA